MKIIIKILKNQNNNHKSRWNVSPSFTDHEKCGESPPQPHTAHRVTGERCSLHAWIRKGARLTHQTALRHVQLKMAEQWLVRLLQGCSTELLPRAQRWGVRSQQHLGPSSRRQPWHYSSCRWEHGGLETSRCWEGVFIKACFNTPLKKTKQKTFIVYFNIW